MPNLWSLFTGPIFKYLLILIVGAIGGYLFSGSTVVARLEAQRGDLTNALAVCEADRKALKGQVGQAYPAVEAAEEQGELVREYERSKPKDPELSGDIDTDANRIFGGRVRKGSGTDDSSSRAPGEGSGSKTP